MMGQIIGISKRLGLQLIRSKWTIPYLILFPAFFILIYWVGFSASEIGANQTFQLGVINQDEGIDPVFKELFANDTIMQMENVTDSDKIIQQGFSYEFLHLLSSMNYSDNSAPIFEMSTYESQTEEYIQQDLKNRRIDIALILPNSFSDTVLSMLNQYWEISYNIQLDTYLQQFDPDIPEIPDFDNEEIIIMGDTGYMNYQFAETYLSSFVEQYFSPRNFFMEGNVYFIFTENGEISLPKYSTFEVLMPGFIVFGIIIQPSLFASFLSEEFRKGRRTFDRIKLSPLSGYKYVLGTLIIQVPLMLLQTLVLFLMGLILGCEFAGNHLLGFLCAISLLPFTASLNYMGAAFMSDEDTVGMIYGFGSPILGFASGAFTSLPQIVLFSKLIPLTSGEKRDFLLWDILPSTHVVNALRNVMLWNFSLSEVLIDLFLNLLISSIFLIVSIYTFLRLRFSRRY